MSLAAELVGERFGKLVVVESAGKNDGKALWLCRCDCGETTTVSTTVLTTGEKRSCGCLHKKHGNCSDKPTKEYTTWVSIKQRCHNPSCVIYKFYGAKGVTVAQKWRDSFTAFLEDMGPAPSPRHSIDRIDPKRGYEPGNCRWATALEQGGNHTNSRFLVYGDETMTVAQAARRFGFRHTALLYRLKCNDWDLAKAIEKPLRQRKENISSRSFPDSEYKTAPEYRTWTAMRNRCNNSKAVGYERYGGAGVKVCERWNVYANFLVDMGRRPSPEHSLDRIDSRGDYEPGNCRWATRVEQANNRTNNLQIEYGGLTFSLKEWSRCLGMKYQALKTRLLNGWTIDRAFTTPVGSDANVKRYSFKGENLALSEWSERLGIANCTLQYRLRSGWSVEQAFTTSPDKSKRSLARKAA